MASWTNYKGLTLPDGSIGDAGENLTNNLKLLADNFDVLDAGDITSGMLAVARGGTGTGTTFTQGYVIFAGAAGVYSVNSGGNFWWDDGNLLLYASRISAFTGYSSNPAFCFESDQDTGIWSAGENNLNFATGGVSRGGIDANGQWVLYSRFSTYTPDGVWSPSIAFPVVIQGPSGGYSYGGQLRIGWSDGGEGEYVASLGFVGSSASVAPNAQKIIQCRIFAGPPGTTESNNRFQLYFDGKCEWGAGNSAVDTNLYRSAAGTLRTNDTLIVDTNLALGATSFGTNAAKVFAIGNGTAPSTSPADEVQVYAADRNATAGKASLHLRVEDGTTHCLGDLVGVNTTNPSSMLDVVGDVEIGSSNAFYLGDPTTDGSWRMTRSGNNLVMQRRESGSWVTKSTITP